jgi:hypothetical protein
MMYTCGGETNLRKLDQVVREWSMVALMGVRHGRDGWSIRLPDQLSVELTYPRKEEIRILNGEAGYLLFRGREPAPAKLPQPDATRVQLVRLYSPLALGHRMENNKLTEEGVHLYLILLDSGLREEYVVNRENWRIGRVVGTLSAKGKDMNFLTEYSEFFVVEGVLMHHRENTYAGRVNTAILGLHKVVPDAECEAGMFEPLDIASPGDEEVDGSTTAMLSGVMLRRAYSDPINCLFGDSNDNRFHS